jgi:hypothetical protein
MKLRKALCDRAFNSHMFEIHPHALEKSLLEWTVPESSKGVSVFFKVTTG